MSATFSTSPELRLRIAESRYPRLFKLSFLGLQLAGLWLITRSGAWGWAPVVVALLLVMHCVGRWQAAKRPPVEVLCWRRGRWWVEAGTGRREVELLRWHCQPWCTYVAWREPGGGRSDLWLFTDSAERGQLRRLRVRLTLQG